MTHVRPSIADKRRTFQQLHEAGCFVIPNPWDLGSARFLQSLGFKALATTSSGFAWSQGYPDGAISRDLALAHLQATVAATDLPLAWRGRGRRSGPPRQRLMRSTREKLWAGVAGEAP